MGKRRPVHGFTAARVVVVGALVAAAVLRPLAQEQLEYVVSFIDANGAALTDVATSEIGVLENGVPGRVDALQPDPRGLDVTMLVDNSLGMGTALGDVRNGAKGFFAALPDDAQVSLLTIAPQPRWLLRPTVGPQNAVRLIDRITPDESLGRFLDAFVEIGNRLKAQSANRFPVIVAVASTNPDDSGAREQQFRQLAERITEYGATVHVAVVTTSAKAAGGRLPGGVTSEVQRTVGVELTRLTGGRYEQIAISSRLTTLLPELGRQVKEEGHRYRVRVRRPDSAKGTVGTIAFGISRPGVTVRATYNRKPSP